MALPRALPLGRFLCSRVNSPHLRRAVSLPCQTLVPCRQFLLGSRQKKGNEDSSASDPEIQGSKYGRSVAIVHMSPHATRSEIETLLTNSGLKIADFEMTMDRFTFRNDCFAAVELGEEQQAREAVRKFHESEFMGGPIYVSPLRQDFKWHDDNKFYLLDRRVYWNDAGISKAVQPIINRRRVHLSVKTPGWGDLKTPISERSATTREILKRTLSQFGLESISRISVNWGDKKSEPRYLCLLDFETKDGAENAISALHDTVIDDRKVWLTPSELAPWVAYQLGRVNKEILSKLQEMELAPKETSIPLSMSRPRKSTEA